MDDREALMRLRSLAYRGDGRGLVTVLGQAPWPADSLQLIGDALLAAISDGIGDALKLARACVNAFESRRWEGDHELAQALAAALGVGPTAMLRLLPVELEELATMLGGDPVYGGGRIDVRPGEVRPRPRSRMPRRSARSTRTIPDAGRGCTGRGRMTDIGTWSGSSVASRTPSC